MLIIKTILNKVQLHVSCYFFLLLAIVTGNFITVLLSSLLLLGHECGHFFTALLLKWPTEKIVFYPFGGISKFQADINRPLWEELWVLLMGPLSQCFLFWVFHQLPLTEAHLALLRQIHYSVLTFNLLPIYPLDGGRILQCFICYFLSYKMSFRLIYFLSYSFVVLLLFFFCQHPSLNVFLILFLLIVKLYQERKKLHYYCEKFLLERYLHCYRFKKSKIVKNEEQFMRDYQHLVRLGKSYQQEHEYLRKRYQNLLKK